MSKSSEECPASRGTIVHGVHLKSYRPDGKYRCTPSTCLHHFLSITRNLKFLEIYFIYISLLNWTFIIVGLNTVRCNQWKTYFLRSSTHNVLGLLLHLLLPQLLSGNPIQLLLLPPNWMNVLLPLQQVYSTQSC